MSGRIGLVAALVSVGAVAVVPATASAGGFSTVGLEAAPPQDVVAGEAWEARFTVLAHGRTPLEHLKPVVRIERAGGKGQRTFRATKTDAPGTYRARVAFPDEGRWKVEVAEHAAIAGSPVAGHSFGTVDVAAAMPSASEPQPNGGPGTLVALAIAAALGLLAGGAAWLVQARPAAPRPGTETG